MRDAQPLGPGELREAPDRLLRLGDPQGRLDSLTYSWDPSDYERHSSLQGRLALEVVEALELSRAGRILDVGCGDGRVTAEIALRAPQARVLGLDLAASMVEHARLRHRNLANLAFQVGDAANLSEGLGRFDLVVSFACLHWLRQPSRALRSLAARLEVGGSLVVQCGAEGNMEPLVRVVEEVRRDSPWREHFQSFRFPFRFCAVQEYAAWLREAGLAGRVERVERAFTLPGPEAFAAWFRAGWRPYVERLPAELVHGFVGQVTRRYAPGPGEIPVPMVRAQVHAERREGSPVSD
ncbi:MAG: methyltransferase domain-containing protein [Candidatus Eremiobacterota bacterium]